VRSVQVCHDIPSLIAGRKTRNAGCQGHYLGASHAGNPRPDDLRYPAE
jgi:hypothetical protein